MKLSYLIGCFVLVASWLSCDNQSGQRLTPEEIEAQEAADSEYYESEDPRDTLILEENTFEERLATYESKDRVFWQKPDLVIDKLGDISEMTIADIGAGSGYFARRLAHTTGKVIAIDIDPNFIEFMDSIKVVELPTEVQDRFETRLATPMDARLKAEEADVVILVNTYIYLMDRVDYLRRLKDGIKPGGRLVIVDFKKKRIPLQTPPASLRVPLFEVERELEEAGYRRIVSDDTSLDYQYIVIARK